ncbi:hypothetical protein EG68_07090 [Paragonimus skrjabini miyazakii]|uniref:Uncharacterized protein n=1 Tax=Paragonimus skrjabini miyazakii TaxID=59628 RepID=A0A8S9YWX8_9TREM|nr:hypothetical protein EG68_07090 [Paragonimus skrjabini miyazakii]
MYSYIVCSVGSLVEPTSYADECSVNENESAFSPFSAQTQSFPVHCEINSPVLPESKPVDKCLMLADLQQIVGSWELNEELAKSLEIRLETLKSTLPKSWPSHASASVTNTVWATAVIIAYFELRLAEQKDEWELLIDKARRWLLDQALAFDKDVTVAKRLCDNLLELAKQMLENQKI